MDVMAGQKRVDHLGLLDSRGPGWLSWPLGYVISAGVMACAGYAAATYLHSGIASGMILPAALVIGGFFGLTLILGTLLCPAKERSFSTLLATQMSVGHALLLVAFVAASFWPVASPYGLMIMQALPIPPQWIPENASLAIQIGPAYIVALTVFSVFAPVSLILFRYVSLSKRT